MSGDVSTAPFRGTEIEKRYMYYWYLSQKELIEQERTQLTLSGRHTHPELHEFGVGTMFGGVLGAKYPMKPRHLIELARDVERIKHIDRLIDKVPNPDCYIVSKKGELTLKPEEKRSGLPLVVPDMNPNNKRGFSVLEPYLINLRTKFGVMEYRAFRQTPIRKWLDEQKPIGTQEEEDDVVDD